MEFCEFGDLNDIYDKHELTGHQKLLLMKQIAQGVEYLHANNIIHRDIKPPNILIASDAPITAKLTDFDFCKFLEPSYDTSLMTTNVGTPHFKAPEFFRRNKQGAINYHRNVDTFAMGLTFLAMIQGNKHLVPQIETPNDHSELYLPIGSLLAERMRYEKKPLEVMPRQQTSKLSKLLRSMNLGAQATSETVPSDIREMIQRMTSVLPDERISAKEVVVFLPMFIPVSFLNQREEWLIV